MPNMKFSDVLRRFDAYPRTLDDFSVRTVGGAAVTIISTSIISLLIFLEFLNYMQPALNEELFVDTTRGHKLRINLDVTLHNLACNYISLDAMDSSGDTHLRVDHDIFKHRLDLKGEPLKETPIKEIVAVSPPNKNVTCGSCYGAEHNATHCCNTCEEVLDAYRLRKWNVQVDKIEQCKGKYKRTDEDAFKEGCRIQGHLEVNRMAGSFHFAPGKSFSIRQFHIHDFQFSNVKLSHTINHLSFGEKIEFAKTHPLDGLRVDVAETKSEMFNYYLKIVPTLYMRQRDGQPIYTNQFSVTRYRKDLTDRERGMPGIFFSYELSPLMVKYAQKHSSFGHFATNCCSIIGGVFTVAGILAVLLNNSWEAIQRKLDAGKLS
ncbi:endoplasmic reticulum-Golgi intermediate compartment protein 3 [Drosophila guanche]|uniref:Endoplasmic reticulum-Golgi intermediate compartment protein 3 n=1 Tax=Drosophila guanche TaxID=7266 RepID=A0A3B0J3N9_DROGU|nr:endoplasmic reticulum-Golgi intermediate compartment protein 3 [Drosophila guanche]SPP75997.1 blast:Endoplasmic reticulum-Golgi intermediate compartment protein 3 [Drosophila guanche]